MIDKRATQDILRRFRDECLQRYPDDIDPMDCEMRSKRLGKNEHNEFLEAVFDGVRQEPYALLAALLDKPRVLKQVLRRIDHAWETLHGEIDFDDLMVVHALQYAAPEVFAFLLNHLSQIRKLEHSQKDVSGRDRKETLSNAWKKEFGDSPHGSVHSLVAFLFPWWDHTIHGIGGTVPQGVRHADPTDYWLRIQAEELSDEQIRDQEVLKALRAWSRNHVQPAYQGESLPVALCKSNRLASKVEHLGTSLTGEEVRLLAGELFTQILAQHKERAHDDTCHAFINIWRMSLHRQWIGHEEWVKGEIEKALPISLRFANCIFYYWRSRSEGEIQAKVPHPELRQAFIRMARDAWTQDCTILLRSLDPSHPDGLISFAVYLGNRDEGGEGFQVDDWCWMGEVMLRASKKAPRLIVPEIIPFLVYQPDSSEATLAFRIQEGQQLFGDGFSEMMKVLATGIETQDIADPLVARIHFATSKAKEWLKAGHV